MIGTLRNFAKTKIAGIFVFIIIIPFVFWGMGSIFNSGNTNNIAKINNTNISTQDFMDYLNNSKLSSQVIKDNLEKNILEELLSTLISATILNLEIKDLDISMSEEIMVKRIKKNNNFLDENGIFKRTIYEKFLLSNNTSAPMFEIKLKNNELEKQLFNYISGGIRSPKFILNKTYKDENKKLYIDYIDLKNSYKKSNSFTNEELQRFVDKNSLKLKQDYIDFSYIKITPKNLVGLDEFNQTFFDKIDEIENKISKNIDFKTIVNDLNITPIIETNYMNIENENTIENKIYNSRKNKIELLEVEDTYIFYHIDKINTKLPNLKNDRFKKQITNLLYQKEKYDFNQKILKEIESKKFNQISFNKLGNNSIEKIKLNSINDNNKFEINSIKILYSLTINDFTLVADDKNNIYVAKIVKYEEKNIEQNSKEFDKFTKDTNARHMTNVLKSYDYFLNNKYKVIVNQKTLERVKNYFK